MSEIEVIELLKASFITVERPYVEGTVEVFEQPVVFDATAPLEQATLTATALGVYAAAIDGEPVTDALFAPGYTYYPRDLAYQTYDVTKLVHAGARLRVELGQGWYCGRFTCDNKTQIYGERPAVSWVLTLTFADGTTQVLTSADATVAAVKSPWDYAGFYDGEIYWAPDALDERPSVPEVMQPVAYTGDLPTAFAPTTLRVMPHEVIEPVAVTEHDGVTIIDFGQNMAGVVEINPQLLNGTSLTLRHGELLCADGSLYTANLRTAKATVVYHKGSETRVWRPRFTYMGFRYVELTGAPWVDGLLVARPIHSEMERTGTFSCGNNDVNRLYLNQLWGQRSNYVEVPTDCPQRDERQGYTGDGQVFARTGAYNFDTRAFWHKFLRDIRMSQQDNTEGYVAPTIPALGEAGIGFITMEGWGNCDTIVPELLYDQFGDLDALRAQYESMKTFVACELRQCGDAGLWMAPNLGDWLAPGRDVAWAAMHNAPVSNAFIVNDLRIMVRAATLLNKSEDAKMWQAEYERVRAAYMAAFVDADAGVMTDDYQGALVMALAYVVPRGELWDRLCAHLVAELREHGMQTGFFATEHLLPLLAEAGEDELAFDLLLNHECPGWLYEVDHGATTIWERWDAILPDGSVNEAPTSEQSSDNMVSFNHYAFGSVGAFMYGYILGIRPLEPGYARVLVEPHVDARLGHAEGSYRSVAGTVSSAWKIEDGTLSVNVTVPVPALVRLPDGTEHGIDPGSYTYQMPYEVE